MQPSGSSTEPMGDDNAIHVDGEVFGRSPPRASAAGADGGDRQAGRGDDKGRRHGRHGWPAADRHGRLPRAAVARQAERHRWPVQRGQGGDRRLCGVRRADEGGSHGIDHALHGPPPAALARMGRRDRGTGRCSRVLAAPTVSLAPRSARTRSNDSLAASPRFFRASIGGAARLLPHPNRRTS